MTVQAPVKAARLGFLGVGWVGLNRMKAVAGLPECEVVAIADPDDQRLEHAAQTAPQAETCDTFDKLLAHDLDGVVIATPSALHAAQTIRALEAGFSVFCQKPLARTASETAAVIETARRANRLLGVDLSYRYTGAMQALAKQLRGGKIGDVYAVDLTFHNAYGPDKAWFYDRQHSGGGCVIDLGIHLLDLVVWLLGQPAFDRVCSHLLAQGKPLTPDAVEDYASIMFEVEGVSVRMSCSWNLPAGCDAVIDATFYGTDGGLKFQNVDGGFYHFAATQFNGTQRETLARYDVNTPDQWGGRALERWIHHLVHNPGYDAEIDSLLDVARIIDAVYANG